MYPIVNQVTSNDERTIEQFGQIDILVNNAGITRDNLLMRMKEDEWDDVINTNLKGVFLMYKSCDTTNDEAAQRHESLILLRLLALSGNPGQANYVAAKAGVIGLTKTAAKELASRDITVNAIAPGFITTDMTDELTEEVKKQMLKQIPLARFGDLKILLQLLLF